MEFFFMRYIPPPWSNHISVQVGSKTKSEMERGMLYQLTKLINRRNVVKKVKNDNMNACEDFFKLETGLLPCNSLVCHPSMKFPLPR